MSGLGLPPPRQAQLVDVQCVWDANPFLLDPSTGQGTGRCAALAKLVPGFRPPGLSNWPVVNPLDMDVTVALPPPMFPSVPAVSSVPRPWFPRATRSTYTVLASPQVVSRPSPPSQTLPPVGDSLAQPDAEVERPVSWSEQVDVAEEHGELEGGPSSTLPGDESEDHSPAMEEEPIHENPPSSPRSPGHNDSIWEDLARASAAAEEFMGEPEAPLGPSLHHRQATLLDFVHPHWLRGEAGISANVRALIHDHGMDYSVEPWTVPWPGCFCSDATLLRTCVLGWHDAWRPTRTHVKSLET